VEVAEGRRGGEGGEGRGDYKGVGCETAFLWV
jgi:hypothetical protein